MCKTVRQQILGQFFPNCGAEGPAVRFLSRVESADELTAGFIFPHNNRGLGNTLHRLERIFNLTQFNAQTPDFYLEVVPAYIDDISILAPVGEVAGLVKVSFTKGNLVDDTLFRRKKKLNAYFEYLHSIGITRPEDITAESIHNYLITLTGLSQKTGAGIVLLLRQFFDAMYLSGIINIELSKHVPTMKLVRQDKIPETWTDDAIERLLAVVDRGNPIGKRDYAVLLIVIRLGLRDSDVRNLKFENIIWSSCYANFFITTTPAIRRKCRTNPSWTCGA